MKKIIVLLLIIPFFITGCFDYKEVDKLAFVTAIGIDYDDEKYELTFEVLAGQNYETESGKIKPYTISTKGKTITDAFADIALKIPTLPHYFHLKAVVISKEVAKKGTKDIIDYITRNPQISNNFYLLLAENSDAKEIIKTKSDSGESIASTLSDLVEYSPKTQNIIFTNTFVDNLETYTTYGMDTTITTIEKEGEKVLSMKGISLFKNGKYIESLDKEDSYLLSSLVNKESNYLIEKEYDDKTFAINIYKTKADYKFSDNKVKINITLSAEIKLNEPNFNLKDNDIYTKLNKEFEKKAKDKYESLIKNILETKTDPLGIANKYYKKTKIKDRDYSFNHDIEIEVKLDINRNGFTYEAKYE